jgi:hypothetical protein
MGPPHRAARLIAALRSALLVGFDLGMSGFWPSAGPWLWPIPGAPPATRVNCPPSGFRAGTRGWKCE